METKTVKAFWMPVVLAISAPAVAQYVSTPPPGTSTQPSTQPATPPTSRGTGNLQLDPKNGQSSEQQWKDRYECHGWAKSQSGYDPTQRPGGATPNGATPNENSAAADGYRRAMAACLESRGYAVHYAAAPNIPAALPPPPPPPPVSASIATHAKTTSSVPTGLRYRPVDVQISGGYTAAVGTTNQLLQDGSNFGFGVAWYPSPALPVALRVDGSYSRFGAKDGLLNQFGGGFTSGHDNIYGGDADLQLDLAHDSPWFKMYLLGGAGWYREQTYLRQVTWESGQICGFYFCEQGYFPVLTATQRTTSPWHSSWNAGFGMEVATGADASFFVEARYQRISAYNEKLQFVPIRFGLRF